MTRVEEPMEFNFDTIDDLNTSMTDFHEEFYHLEEQYLDRFGVYPTMPELSKETLEFYVGRIKRCLSENRMMEDLE